MSREIKFRAWDKKYKEMSSFETMMSRRHLAITPKLRHDQFIVLPLHENVVLMQFTGLNDKNGKEIYEGDIIADDTYGNYTAEWSGYYCQFLLTHVELDPYDLTKYKADRIEVIGNIYENPELLVKP